MVMSSIIVTSQPFCVTNALKKARKNKILRIENQAKIVDVAKLIFKVVQSRFNYYFQFFKPILPIVKKKNLEFESEIQRRAIYKLYLKMGSRSKTIACYKLDNRYVGETALELLISNEDRSKWIDLQILNYIPQARPTSHVLLRAYLP